MYTIETDIETVGPVKRPIYRIYKEFSAWDNTWKELVATFYNPDKAKEYINFKNQTKPMNSQNKRHPHAEQIKAWADGATIQIKKDNGEWEDCLFNRPAWNEKTEYRIKPEGNERSKPKKGKEYFFMDVIDGEIRVDSHRWDDDKVDDALYRLHNIFPTKEEAEAAIPHVEAALKGVFTTDNNVGSKSEIAGNPLTDGEKELIKALRHAGRITDVYDYRTTVLVSSNDNASGVYTHRQHIAFFTSSSDADDELIISALKKIQAEQKEGR